MKARYAIIILAAGGSSRLGKPKQVLQFQNSTLLTNVVKAAAAIDNNDIIVVTGAYAEEVEKSITVSNVHIVMNNEWQSGLASSIRTGINQLQKINSEVDTCIIAVSDQPFVSGDTFSGLIEAKEATNKGICASSYKGTAGTPALFDKKYFNTLLSLDGDEGAKKIITGHPDDVTLVPFEKGSIDIDTEQDYEKLKNQQ